MSSDIFSVLAQDDKWNRLGSTVEYVQFYGFSDHGIYNIEIAVCYSDHT